MLWFQYNVFFLLFDLGDKQPLKMVDTQSKQEQISTKQDEFVIMSEC